MIVRPGAFKFSGKWVDTIKRLGETGMGYTVVTVTLADGRVFPQTIIDSGNLSRVRGHADVPFSKTKLLA